MHHLKGMTALQFSSNTRKMRKGYT